MEEFKQIVTDKAVDSLKWSVLMEVISRVAHPIIFIVLARLLTPADFGVVATAMIAISFSQMFWDAGLSKALIQTRLAPEDVAHVVFWTNVFLGLLIYLLLFLSAPAITLFFKSTASGPVLRVLGIQIVIASLSSVQQALFIRDLNFRGLFWIKLLTAFIPGMFSIPLALSGYGVWALVAGSLAGQALNLYLLWNKSRWRPQIRYDTALARSLFGFGFWAVLESFGAWLNVWGDNLIVGRFLGVHDLGVYRTGSMLVGVIFGLVLNPFVPMLYPTFCRLQDDLQALKKTFHGVTRVVIALVLPMGVGLSLVGSEIALLLFGEKWHGLGFVLCVFGLTYSISWLTSINPEIYRAMGKPNVSTVVLYAHISYYLPCFYFASQYGLETFVITRLTVTIVSVPIQTYFCVRMLGVSPFYLWHEGKPFIISTTIMAAGISILKWGIFPNIAISEITLSIGILTVVGGLIYLATLWVLDSPFVLQMYSIIKKASLI